MGKASPQGQLKQGALGQGCDLFQSLKKSQPRAEMTQTPAPIPPVLRADMKSQLLQQTEIVNHHTQEGKTETGDRRQGEAEMHREGQRETGRKPGAGGREGETGTGKAQDGQGPRMRVVGRLLQALLSDPSFRVWWLANLRYGGLPGVKGVGVSPLPLSPPGAMSPVP